MMRTFAGGMSVGGVALMLLFTTAGAIAAEPAKPAPKPELPVIRLVQPIGIEAGKPTKLRVRGQFFDGVTAMRFQNGGVTNPVQVGAAVEAKSVTGFDAARIGDRQFEVELNLPATAQPGTNAVLTITGPAGESLPFPLLVLPAGTVTGEKEPNDGFRAAPGATLPIRLRGAMEARGDVDVFRVELKAGRTFRAEILAARWKSTLDAMLTVYDVRYAVIASVDDSLGRDPLVEFEVKDSGEYFVAVSYANDQAASTHEYVLSMEEK